MAKIHSSLEEPDEALGKKKEESRNPGKGGKYGSH